MRKVRKGTCSVPAVGQRDDRPCDPADHDDARRRRAAAGRKSTLGNPAEYTCCFAENEADSPSAPLHVERGFEAETSTITAFGGAVPANIIDKSKTASEMLATIARAVAVSDSNNMFMSQEALVILGPEHASIAARQGFDKQRVRQALFEHARIQFEQIGHSNADVLSVWRGNCIEDRRRTLRIAEKPENIISVVAGGAGLTAAAGGSPSNLVLPAAPRCVQPSPVLRRRPNSWGHCRFFCESMSPLCSSALRTTDRATPSTRCCTV